MRQTITLPMSGLSLNKSYRINQFITSICKTLEKRLQTNYTTEQSLIKKLHNHEGHTQFLEFKMINSEANNHKSDIKRCEDRIQKMQRKSADLFDALRFLSYLDFVRRASQTDHFWSGDVYYCDTTIRKTVRAHHHQMATNVQIEIKNQELEITIDTTDDTKKSHPDFVQRLYNSFCALSDGVKIESADHAHPRRPSPLAIDDNPDTEPADTMEESFISRSMQLLRNYSIFSPSATQRPIPQGSSSDNQLPKSFKQTHSHSK